MKLTADDRIPFLKGVFEQIGWRVAYVPGTAIDRAALRDSDALMVRTRTRCDEALLDRTPVRFVATATIGFDHLDAAWLERAGIGWANAPGCNAGSVAQYVASALTRLPFPAAGSTLGIVGVGHVGRKVAEIGRAFGMNVLLCDPPRRDAEPGFPHTELDELLAKSDVVTLHTPLERAGKYPTFHLIGDDALNRMKPGAWLFNTSRGPVADNAALLRLLRTRRAPRGAVLDVWEGEPAIDRELLALVDYGTPHIAGYSTDGKAGGTEMAVRAIAGHFGIAELASFTVSGLPEPAVPELGTLDFALAVRAAYDLAADSEALKNAPGDFEKLRNFYGVRREFRAYRTARPEDAFRIAGFSTPTTGEIA